MENAYSDIATEVDISGFEPQQPAHERMVSVKRWFESDASGQWLLIVDSADDVALMYGESCKESSSTSSRLGDFLPRSTNGSILLTMRNKVAAKFAPIRSIAYLLTMTPTGAESLLFDRLNGVFTKFERDRLAKLLNRVPLAMVQAAAFIITKSCSFTTYLDLYNESDANKVRLLRENFEDDVRDPEIQNPVATTLGISFKQIHKQNTLTVNLLSSMAMLDPKSIPKSLLPLSEDEKANTEALGDLLALSLITKGNDIAYRNEPSFDLHRLVRIAAHNWLSVDESIEKWTSAAIRVLLERIPKGDKRVDQLSWPAYIPHALALLSSDQTKSIEDAILSQDRPLRPTMIAEPPLSQLLLEIARRLQSTGDYSLAESMSWRAWNIEDQKSLGLKNPATLGKRYSLACILNSQGKYETALKMAREVLDDQLVIKGAESVGTMKSKKPVVRLLRALGQDDEAEVLCRQLLDLARRVLGENYNLIIRTKRDIANVFGRRGYSAEAEMICREVLNAEEDIKGSDRHHVLTAKGTLAELLRRKGDLEDALKLHEEILEARKRVCGPGNPSTLWNMTRIARILEDLGKYDESLRLQVYGETHHEVLYSMSLMSRVLCLIERYDAAEEMCQRFVNLNKMVYGLDHPNTLISMKRLE